MSRKTKESAQLPDWQKLFNKFASKSKKPKKSSLRIFGHKYFPMPKNPTADGQYMVATIAGNELKDAGIFSGNWIMYRATSAAVSHDLVVVDTPHGKTVKFYQPQANGKVHLLSANDRQRPLVFSEKDIIIRGVVVASGRDFEPSAH